MNLDVTMSHNIAFSDIDIVAILADLMENAIYGCLKSEKAHQTIDVHIGRKVNKLVIYVSNTADGDVVFENGLPKSQTGGGIGVTGILRSAARYGGEYDFRNEDGRFACQILLKVPWSGRLLKREFRFTPPKCSLLQSSPGRCTRAILKVKRQERESVCRIDMHGRYLTLACVIIKK